MTTPPPLPKSAEPKQKNGLQELAEWYMRRSLITRVLLALIALSVMGAILSPGERRNPPQQSASPKVAVAQPANPTPAPTPPPSPTSIPMIQPVTTPAPQTPRPTATPEPTVRIGQAFTLGKFRYVITGRQTTQFIGNQFVNKRPGPGATFLIVSYTIENVSNETATSMTGDFQLIDSQGRKFTPSSNAETALAMTEENQDWLLSQLQPGVPKAAKQVFEVPLASVQAPGLKLVVPEKGLFATGKAIIPMNY